MQSPLSDNVETTAEGRSRSNVPSLFLFQARIGVLCQSCVALLTHPRLLAHLLDVSIQTDHICILAQGYIIKKRVMPFERTSRIGLSSKLVPGQQQNEEY